MDRSFVALNQAATDRLRALAARLTDQELQRPVGAHWTGAIALAHLAFWDRRVLHILEMTERTGALFTTELAGYVNDVSLPLWAAVPPREAARLAVASAEAVDRRLEAFPLALLEAAHAHNPRWVVRALHRNEHLDEVEAALR